MKWIGLTGSWRQSAPGLVQDLEREVGIVLNRGDGIVAGGALGVDYLATELALRFDPTGKQLKVILPAPLSVFRSHYLKRAKEGVIALQMAQRLITQIEQVASVGSLIEMNQFVLTTETYYRRNTQVVAASDELLAFQVNGSPGTQDTIDKARAKGVPVRVFTYETLS